MQIVDLATPVHTAPCAVALGYFDTFHLGHRRLLDRVKESGYVPAMFTFGGDFYGALGRSDVKPLYSDEERMRLAQEMGVELVLLLQSSEANMRLDCLAFFDLLCKANPRLLVCGEDFRFGASAKGDAALLAALCRERNIDVEILPILRDDVGDKIGTMSLRDALARGDMERMRAGLGRYYSLYGTVRSGRGVGRTIGVPTANVDLDKRVQSPRFGVYACIVYAQGKRYDAVCNVGSHPTFGDAVVNLETHLLDYTGDLYGQKVRLDLVSYLRPVREFERALDLRRQIALDCQLAKQKIKENDHD